MEHQGEHQTLAPVFIAVDTICFTLSTAAILARLVTRIHIIPRSFGMDDATILLAQTITAIRKGFVASEITVGLGQHRSILSTERYRNYLEYDYLDKALFFVALAVCKISICLFLLRLSQMNRLRHVLYGLMIFLILTHVPLFLMLLLQCQPLRKAWEDVPGKCLSIEFVKNVIIAQGVFSFTTDFVCAAFPAALLWDVKIKRRDKVGLCILMGVGVITGVIAIIRTAFAPQVKSNDRTWVGVPSTMTRCFEVNIGIIAACTPMMKPFFRYIIARITGKDPHAILRPAAEQRSFHSSWFSRLWPSRSSPDKSQVVQKDIVRLATLDNETGGVSRATDITLNLPLQGTKDSECLEPPLRQETFDFPGGLQTADVKSVNDRV